MNDQQRIALIETRTMGDDSSPQQQIRYQFGNHLGSASLELDDTAQVISYEEYSPHGSTSYQAVRIQTETPKRYRYTGKERDEENGLYYHGARYYAPWLARWTATDPANLRDGTNLYQYVRNNPVMLSDPSGAQAIDDEPFILWDIWKAAQEERRLERAVDEAIDREIGAQSRVDRRMEEHNKALNDYLDNPTKKTKTNLKQG